jgi:isopenicillin-N N-acyltransferase like protein
MPASLLRGVLCASLLVIGARSHAADTSKEAAIKGGASPQTPAPEGAKSSADPGGSGYRTIIANGDVKIPVVVVRGTPYQMGWHLGRLCAPEMKQFVPAAVAGFKQELQVDDETLDRTWATTAGYTDPRVQQQLVGAAEGSGLPMRLLQHVHCLPLLMPYSCSCISAWGDATEDGHLYQTRNLDWALEAGAHEFPVLIVYLPTEGEAHITPSFAGFFGAHCGMNASGVVLSEIGDASAKEMPYNLHAPHFTAWFRTLLYDANSLSEALTLFRQTPQTKRYHFVFGDGLHDKRAVKIRVAAPLGQEPQIDMWSDSAADDELAPNTLSDLVYHDEGRGAFPTLEAERGKINGPSLVALANQIPIKGGNVMNVVFDATAMRLWVSYAGGDKEAYQRPYVMLDLTTLDADADGRPDWPSPRVAAK